MNATRIGLLLTHEVRRGPKMLLIFATVVPLVLTLLITLLFGSLLSSQPHLGVADAGVSQLATLAQELEGISVSTYSSDAELQTAVESGRVDMGLALPADFDRQLQADGGVAHLVVYVWGESLLRDRLLLGTALAGLARQVQGDQLPVELTTIPLGDETNVSWEDRLLPFIVLMAVMLGGMMIPASALITEKQKRTLRALTITPTTLGDIFVAKGTLGFVVSLSMGIVILLLNGALGAQPFLLLLVLALGACLSAAFGVVLGVLMRDMNSLFATVKAMGLLLYAPAIFFLFPTLPQWIGRIFPTYYIIGPIVAITQRGAGWAEIATDVLILVGLIGLMLGVLAWLVQRSGRLDEAALI